jgi:hypothetical protein
MNTSIINMQEWQKKRSTTNVTTTFEYEDCAKAFVEYFSKVNGGVKTGIVATCEGDKVTFSIPNDHHEISRLSMLASTKFFEAGYKVAHGE